MSSYVQRINGKDVTFVSMGPDVVPAFEQVTAVAAIPFTADGKLVVVNLRHRGLDLPGGHVEPDETTPLQTMNREVMEEAYMTVRTPVLAEVIRTDFFDDRPSYIMVYGVYVDELQEFIPSEEVSERVMIEPDQFIERYEAGDKRLAKQAIARAWDLLVHIR